MGWQHTHWKDNPSHYSAVHFHQDDMTNADWDETFVWAVPADLPSGQYALKLSQDDSEDYVMFFVRPGSKTPKADVLYLVPTASYLAYANHRMNLWGGWRDVFDFQIGGKKQQRRLFARSSRGRILAL